MLVVLFLYVPISFIWQVTLFLIYFRWSNWLGFGCHCLHICLCISVSLNTYSSITLEARQEPGTVHMKNNIWSTEKYIAKHVVNAMSPKPHETEYRPP